MCVYLLFGVSSGTSHMDNGSTRAVCFVTRFACRSCDSYPVAVASNRARGGGVGCVKAGAHETRDEGRVDCCARVLLLLLLLLL